MSTAKPYNPVLGETFECHWDHPAGPDAAQSPPSRTCFVAEAVSHHPPIQSTLLYNQQAGFLCQSTGQLTPWFLGNRVEVRGMGESWARFYLRDPATRRVCREQYRMTERPNMALKGIFIGPASICVNSGRLALDCPETNLAFDVTFNSDALQGFVSRRAPSGGKPEPLLRIVGNVRSQVRIVDMSKGASSPNGRDGDSAGALWIDFQHSWRAALPKLVKPVSQQDPLESRRVWHGVTYSLANQDYDQAMNAKHRVEEHQRKIRKQKGFAFVPRLFKPSHALPSGLQVHKHVELEDIEAQIVAECSRQLEEPGSKQQGQTNGAAVSR